MRTWYFELTDTPLIELKEAPVTETRDLDQNTVLDVNQNGHNCAMTIEHTSKRTGVPQHSCDKVTA